MIRLIIAVCLLSAASYGTTYMLPEPKLAVSPDGATLIRVTHALVDTLRPGANATVLTFDEASGGYKKASEFSLTETRFPLEIFITNDARFIATLDDFPLIGRSKNAVMLYRGTGELIKAWKLTDIFSNEEIKEITPRHPDVAITWRGSLATGSVEFSNNRLLIRPYDSKVPGKDAKRRPFLVLEFETASLVRR